MNKTLIIYALRQYQKTLSINDQNMWDEIDNNISILEAIQGDTMAEIAAYIKAYNNFFQSK